ncbi:MAG: LamG domain-containing protein [Methanotrichaceae archaeon]|nr:LamG domain-containing protein [Methanotrichaceae archaeon]
MKWVTVCLLVLVLLLSMSVSSFAQEKVWERKFGGSNFDIARDVHETKSGDYVFVGSTKSYGKGGSDVWVGVTDPIGNMIWDKYFGGKEDDEGYSIKQTQDEGYIVAGNTKSFGAGGLDAYIFKIDSKGAVQWERPFGGTDNDEAFSINQTRDYGYIATGYTKSNSKGGKDLWVIKLDPQGDREWEKTYGGSYEDEGRDVTELHKGGYAVTGYTTLPGGGGKDLWILELDEKGNKIGEVTFGADTKMGGKPPQDIGYSIKETNDSAYVVAGVTESSPSNPDFLLIKANSNNKIWDRTFGGKNTDEAFSVDLTPEGGFIIAGRSKSFQPADFNVWLVRADPEGSELWNATIGGSGEEAAYAVKATSDGRYILAGLVGGMGQGGDAWIIKVKDPQAIPAAYYPLNGTAMDVSGNGQNGRIVGAVSTNSTTKSRAFFFDGIDDYISIPPLVKDDFSILFWVMTDQTARDYIEAAAHWWAGNGLVDAKVCGNSDDFGVALLGKRASFGIGNTDVTIKSSSTINDGKWHHIAATRSRRTGIIKLYVDGVLEEIGNASRNQLTSPSWMSLGNNPCDVENNKRWFRGYLYDLKIYNRLLGSQDIKDIYLNSKYDLP